VRQLDDDESPLAGTEVHYLRSTEEAQALAAFRSTWSRTRRALQYLFDTPR
jgi:hypothetical protein